VTEHQGDDERRIHRSADTPVIAVQCDDPAHDEPFIVARFAKPPAGTWIGFGAVSGSDWLPLPILLDPEVNPERQHLSRSGLNIADTEHGVRYRLECRKHRITVPIRQENLNPRLDAAQAAGHSAVSLSALDARLQK
jgi:hypothetical protein